MKLRVFLRNKDFSVRPEYGEPSFDTAKRDLLSMEQKMTDNHIDLVYSFDEYAAGKSINVTFMDTGELTSPHHHDFYEINIVLNGSLIEHIGNEFYTLHTGDILVMHPSVIHSLYTFRKCRAVNVLIEPKYFDKIRLLLGASLRNTFLDDIVDNRSFSLFSTRGDDFAKTLCENMFAYWKIRAPHNYSILALEADLVALLTLLSQKHSAIENDMPPTLSDTKEKRQQVVRFIRDHFATVTIKEVSAVFGYSPSQIYRIVKQETGNSMQGVIMSKRLFLSMRLLSDTNYSISQIAEIVGITCGAYFSRFFYSQVGYTPMEYRKSVRNGTYRHNEDGLP